MKKLKVKKGSTCMACLACVGACSEAFYKVFDPDKACLQIVEKKAVRPIACPQCGKCAEAIRLPNVLPAVSAQKPVRWMYWKLWTNNDPNS